MTKDKLKRAKVLEVKIDVYNTILSRLKCKELKLCVRMDNVSYGFLDDIDADANEYLIKHYKDKLNKLEMEFAEL